MLKVKSVSERRRKTQEGLQILALLGDLSETRLIPVPFSEELLMAEQELCSLTVHLPISKPHLLKYLFIVFLRQNFS